MLNINELFLEIRKQVEDIVQQELIDCDWYIGVSSSVCNGGENDALLFHCRYKCVNVNSEILPVDLTTDQDQFVTDVIELFVKNYKNHDSGKCDFFDTGCGIGV